MVKISLKNKIALALFILLFIFSFVFFANIHKQNRSSVFAENTYNSEKIFTSQELKKFDGSDPGLPIYLALDGMVYDVTPGKEYYKKGGPYHSLAGKDSSEELHMAGGSIIKKKYKIVGTLE